MDDELPVLEQALCCEEAAELQTCYYTSYNFTIKFLHTLSQALM